MKVLILPDGTGWVVDRNCQALVTNLPSVDFTLLPYTRSTSEEFINKSAENDLIHYFNSDVKWHWHSIKQTNKPLLITIRSHRYPSLVKRLYKRPNTWFHVINEDLLKDFPNATYIPNGIFEHIKPSHKFTVGLAARDGKYGDLDYKGIDLIKEACKKLGIRFKPAHNLSPEKMPDYYESIDLYVCASKAEGFSTPVMECLAMNVPVISTDVGVARKLDIVKIPRTVEGIVSGIKKYYTQEMVKEYTWQKVAPEYKKLYVKILKSNKGK